MFYIFPAFIYTGNSLACFQEGALNTILSHINPLAFIYSFFKIHIKVFLHSVPKSPMVFLNWFWPVKIVHLFLASCSSVICPIYFPYNFLNYGHRIHWCTSYVWKCKELPLTWTLISGWSFYWRTCVLSVMCKINA